MHFLLVNDDGIGAPGIMALVRASLRQGHTVSMCAPLHQQSAASHRFTLRDPIYVKEWPLENAPGCEAFSIDGTPADCVRIGLGCMTKQHVDAVISGINYGYNAGISVHYSGTVGAAMEGVFHHLPSVAVSIHESANEEMLDHLADFAVSLAARYALKSVPEGTLLNINAPAVPPAQLKDTVYCPLDTAYFTDGYERREAPRRGTYFWLGKDGGMEEHVPGSDMDYLNKGHRTVTLIGGPVCLGKDVWQELGLEEEARRAE